MTVIITSKRNGFRRCGVAHPDKPTPYPDEFFTAEQLEALSKEPQLILAYAQDEFDQVQDSRDESLQEVDPAKAPDAAQNAQPQAPETIATTLGDAVVLPVDPLMGNREPGPDGSGLAPFAPLIEQNKGLLNSTDIELDVLWEEALKEELAREEAKAQAAKPPAKPDKVKSAKSKDEVK